MTSNTTHHLETNDQKGLVEPSDQHTATAQDTTSTTTIPHNPDTSTSQQPTTRKSALLDKLKQKVGHLDKVIDTTPTTTAANGKKASATSSNTAEPITPTRSKRTRRPNKFINGEEAPCLPEEIQKKLLKLMSAVRKHRWAWPFSQPVDPVQLKIPDYFEVIKNPMDLGTVEKKVMNNEYMDVYQFLDDVRLIWSNCYTYNPTESDVAKMCKELEKFFNEKYHKLVGVVDYPVYNPGTVTSSESTSPVAVITTPPASSSTSKPKKGPGSGRGRKKKEPTTSSTTTTPAKQTKKKSESSTKKASTSEITITEMSYEEKKVLSANIGKLSEPEFLTQVVRIIQSRAPKASSKASEDVIEIDLDKLDNITLRELESFVNSHLPAAGKHKKAATTTKKKRKTSPAKSDKKSKKTKKEEKNVETESSGSSATDNSASESSASETDSSDSDSSSGSDSEQEDTKMISHPPSLNMEPKPILNEGKLLSFYSSC